MRALLALLILGAPPSVEDPELAGLVERAKRDASPDGRARAIEELRTSRVRGATKELMPQLAATKLGDRESRALLALFKAQREPQVADLVRTWLVGQLGEYAGKILADPPPPSLTGGDVKAAVLEALPLMKIDAEGRRALATLATHTDLELARPAAKLAADRGGFRGADYLDHWLVLLSRPNLDTQELALRLLAGTRSPKAIGPIIASAERHLEANPRQNGSPSHAKVLRALTGKNFGNHPAAWRKWWDQKQNR